MGNDAQTVCNKTKDLPKEEQKSQREKLEAQIIEDYEKRIASKDPQIKEMFEKYDKNGDGFMDRSELRSLFNDIAGTLDLSPDEIADVDQKFDEADINKDGKLSYEEFKEVGRFFFKFIFKIQVNKQLDQRFKK